MKEDDSVLEICPDCEGTQLQEQVRSYSFAYGVDGPGQVQIPVTHVVLVCTNESCGAGWSDWRGEEARTAAVQKHLRERESA